MLSGSESWRGTSNWCERAAKQSEDYLAKARGGEEAAHVPHRRRPDRAVGVRIRPGVAVPDPGLPGRGARLHGDGLEGVRADPSDGANPLALVGGPESLGRVLHFKGSLNVQFRLTDRGCVAFEINPRFSSTVYFRHCFGFKDVLWTLDLFEGKAIHYTHVYKKGVGVRKFSEVIFEEEKF